MQPSVSTRLRSQIVKILWITVFWSIVSVFQFLTSYSTLIQLDFDFSGLSPLKFLQGSIISGLAAGLIGGSCMVFFWDRWLRTKSYRRTLFNIFWSFTMVYLIVAIISGLYFHSGQLNLSFFHPDVWKATFTENSVIHIQNYLFFYVLIHSCLY